MHIRSFIKGKAVRNILPAWWFWLLLPGSIFAFQQKAPGDRNENDPATGAWIRINQLGYLPAGVKVAVWCSKDEQALNEFKLVDAISGDAVFLAKAGKPFGSYGPFSAACRLDFSAFHREGIFFLQAGSTRSRTFVIKEGVYAGAADFCLRYMRQQRSGFNPFLKDSCHTHDGYTLYGPMQDSTHLDVVGGWHDASDYLQYVTTSANATYHLLAAYRDFPGAFEDHYQSNGLKGKNGVADVLDEAKWGLDWLLKMHPQNDWLFNQIGDDRDHQGMRLPKEDTNFYGKGLERPVYFCTGLPQGMGKYKNRSTGLASTAGKFASAFALGYLLFDSLDKHYAGTLLDKAASAWLLGLKKPGVCQTAPGRSPYFYEEENWTDDMELASAVLYQSQQKIIKEHDPIRKMADPLPEEPYRKLALQYARQEPVTPWLGADTARHYQWYPFVNIGHYELAKALKGKQRLEIIAYYRQGLERVWQKAKQNAFFRGIPFIWCSNNLTTAFAIQCYWYRKLSGDGRYIPLEQACFDWLFGCNPWGTGFVYGLPGGGLTPSDPHSAFTHLGHYPADGGLVDGPVYGNIYKKLIGITLYHPDAYKDFQSGLVVYHDDYGDYSTNEPTMDGTASLVYLLAAREAEGRETVKKTLVYDHGAIIRGDSAEKKIAIVFTGDEFAEGGPPIAGILRRQKVRASFFLTGRCYRNPLFRKNIRRLIQDGHYLGGHSDRHLLYCDWNRRDSLLVTKAVFTGDLLENYRSMQAFGIKKEQASFFLPPYEWYNDSIALWTTEMGLRLINFTPGTKSNADYTLPGMANYRNSKEILESILQYEKKDSSGLNGFILLLHAGTDPRRTDKFYGQLEALLLTLKARGYEFERVNELLRN